MRFRFTNEDRASMVHISALCASLIEHGHSLVDPREKLSGDEIWMYGLSATFPSIERRREVMLSGIPYYLYQCDESLYTAIMSTALIREAKGVLRNHWHNRLDMPMREKTGYLPPMMLPVKSNAGLKLSDRPIRAGFWGYPREERNKMMKVLRQTNIQHNSQLSEEAKSRPVYETLMQSCRFSLTPWGVHPITYRFFEGLAFRCCVFAQSISHIDILDLGLKPGVHYVEVASDFSDLEELIVKYTVNSKAAQEIADAGYEHYCSRLEPTTGALSEPMYSEMIKGWKLA